MKKEKIFPNVIIPILVFVFYFIINKYYPGIYEKLQNSSSVREQFLSVKLVVFGMLGVIFDSVCILLLIIFEAMAFKELKKYDGKNTQQQIYIDGFLNGANIMCSFLAVGCMMFVSLSFGGALQTSENWDFFEEIVFLLNWLGMIASGIAFAIGIVIHSKLVKRRQTIGEQGRMELLQDEVLVEKEKVRVTNETNEVYAKTYKIIHNMLFICFGIMFYLSFTNYSYSIAVVLVGIVLGVSCFYSNKNITKIENCKKQDKDV